MALAGAGVRLRRPLLPCTFRSDAMGRIIQRAWNPPARKGRDRANAVVVRLWPTHTFVLWPQPVVDLERRQR